MSKPRTIKATISCVFPECEGKAKVEIEHWPGYPGVWGGPPDHWAPPEPDENYVTLYECEHSQHLDETDPSDIVDYLNETEDLYEDVLDRVNEQHQPPEPEYFPERAFDTED